jgi:lipopolysaccharide exporter
MRGEIAKGAAWMVLFRLFDRSIGIVSTAILARLLIPADFGLVAMAMSIIALIELATAFSFEIALIQKQDPQRAHFDTAWTLNILVAVGGAILTAAAAYPAAIFYGDPRLGPVMFAIGGAWLVSGFESTGTANFRREMNFAAEFRLMSAKRVVSFVITIGAAVVMQSYWALVIGMTSGRIVGVILSYAMHPYRPRLSLEKARDLFSFSGWVLVNNIAAVIGGRVPHFFIGRAFGAQALGAYTVAAEIAQLAHTELIAPINRAMFPGYSRLVGDPQAFRKTCLDATATILLIVLPVSIGIAVLAAPFVRLLLGDQWGEAVPIIKVLAFAGAATALTSNNVSAYLALGRPHLATSTFITRLVVLGVGIAILYQPWGVLGIAYAELIAAAASMAVSLPILLATIHVRLLDYLRALWRPLVASAMMGIVIVRLLDTSSTQVGVGEAAIQLITGTVIGMLTYPLILAALWLVSGRPDSVEVRIMRWAWDAIRARRARGATA